MQQMMLIIWGTHFVRTFFATSHYWYNYHPQPCFGDHAPDKLMNVTQEQQPEAFMLREKLKNTAVHWWRCHKIARPIGVNDLIFSFVLFVWFVQSKTFIINSDPWSNDRKRNSNQSNYNALYLLDLSKQPWVLHKQNQQKLPPSFCCATGIFSLA